MAAKIALVIGLSLILGTAVCSAEDWTTTDGKTYQNVKVVSFNDGYVTIIDSDGGARIPLRLLNSDLQRQFNYNAAKAAACEAATNARDNADQQAVAAQKQATTGSNQQATTGSKPLFIVIPNGFSPISSAPPYRTAAATQPTVVTNSDNPLAGLKLNGDADGSNADAAPESFLGKFSGHLVVLNNGHTKPADRALLDGVKYVAFYYSASWCAPCRAFTPKLVTFYNNFKPMHPNFELIFVNRDESEDDMLAYMVSDNMTWPAVRFDDIDSSRLKARQFEGSGIPDLVLVDDQGKVLADSFVDGEYYGPDPVMNAIMQKVPLPSVPTATATSAEGP